MRRWQAEEGLTDEQAQEVARLVEQTKKIRENTAQVLVLANELARSTIEKQMAKSDLELGPEALMNPDILRRRG